MSLAPQSREVYRELLGENGGEVGLLEGLLAQSTGVDRKAGFEQGIADCPYPVEIVATRSPVAF
jgi:ABC-type sugar transport system substrate-binding protein